jgi:hypothetical protein
MTNQEVFFGRASLLSGLPSRRVLLGQWAFGTAEQRTTTRQGTQPPFFYAPDPSTPRSSCRHSSFNAVPPIRQRFSWPRRVSHTIAPHLTHMEACSLSSTGYHVPPRVWPRLPAVSSQLASALWYCSVSSPRHIFDLKISHTSRVYMVKMDYFTELPRSRLSPGPIDRGSSEAHLLCRKRKSGETLGKNLGLDRAFNGIPHGSITLLAL